MIVILSRAEAQEIVDIIKQRIDCMQYDHYANDEEETCNQAMVVLLKGLITKLTLAGDAV